MASIMKDIQGPDWPLGFIAVPTPGTPVNVMSLVDPGNVNAPGSPTTPGAAEYTPTLYSILFQAVKPAGGNSHGMVNTTGNVYVVRSPTGNNAGNRDDPGAMLAAIAPGQQFTLLITPGAYRGFSPYRYFVDADNAGDGALTLGTVA